MSTAQPSVWNEERLEQLQKLWAEGLSITQIGNMIGVSRNAVVGKVHRMGLPKRQSPIVRSDKPIEPRRRKMSPEAYADLGRNKCSWPIGDPRDPGFRFCGEEAEPGRPYCTAHCAVAYTTKSETKAA